MKEKNIEPAEEKRVIDNMESAEEKYVTNNMEPAEEKPASDNKEKKHRKRKAWKKFLLILALILGIFAVGCLIYVNQYYHSTVTLDEARAKKQQVCVTQEKGYIEILPADSKPETAFIFYPGGKVEYTAYLPMLETLASRDVACYLMKMPCNLAVFDMDAAEKIRENDACAYERWYVGGHSLGGAMAASYVAKEPEDYEGLVLLGAYATEDLTGTDLKVLSLYGSEDGVLNWEKYIENKGHLPEDTQEVELKGGNHAYYGNYGEQKGDGTAKITREEQQALVVEAMMSFVNNE